MKTTLAIAESPRYKYMITLEKHNDKPFFDIIGRTNGKITETYNNYLEEEAKIKFRNLIDSAALYDKIKYKLRPCSIKFNFLRATWNN